ncbi:DUF1491 family protein [Tsuneonella sp. YG55]|uniref:DUF1491 family protein n=1 Tax=Tsuneonella litorea TaxID=2976475 RepID=A0A9X3AM53_9SPHN|nr:DUF1491 family protein [Tsuneonella litorea]MCT2557882.1 DUF1491 family protein [Tsuneonella litorea]
MEGRLPAHIEVAGIRRLAESLGGFATVLAKGERDAGTIAIVIIGRGEPAALYERMPQLDGNRRFVLSVEEISEKKQEFSDILARRTARDPDLWLIEADVPDKERFVAGLPA